MFTTAQARTAGLDWMTVKRLRDAGLIRVVRHGVHAAVGAPLSPLEQVRAEWLALDPARTAGERSHDPHPGIVSEETAATIHGFGDFGAETIRFVTSARTRSRQPFVRLTTSTISPREWSWIDGLPVTTPRRTLEDLARSGRWDRDHIVNAVASAVRHGTISAEEIGRSRVLSSAVPEVAPPVPTASVMARLNEHARRSGRSPQAAQGGFFRTMFLHELRRRDRGWVLKGGSGIAARYPQARETQDLDLFNERSVGAHESASNLANVMDGARIGDLMFRCTATEPTPRDDGADLCRVTVEVLGGARPVGRFDIDVSANLPLVTPAAVMTVDRADDATIPGYPSRITFALYPVENQIADKACAMYATYRSEASTRYRDLYDLAFLCDRAPVNADALLEALRVQQDRRSLVLPASIAAPSEAWPTNYDKAARKMPGTLARYQTFAAAAATVAAVLNPLLAQLNREH
jgi:hypothetical protein